MEIAGSVQRRPLILVSLLLAAFVINLDITIVNVALAALLLAAGSLSDRLGRKGFLLAGLVVFGAASIAGGLTDTAGQLIVARCFMGLGAAMMFPTTLSLISNVLHRAGRARQGDRPLGRDGGHRDRARPDRRGLAARAVQLDEHDEPVAGVVEGVAALELTAW
jgi:MFS family permease